LGSTVFLCVLFWIGSLNFSSGWKPLGIPLVCEMALMQAHQSLGFIYFTSNTLSWAAKQCALLAAFIKFIIFCVHTRVFQHDRMRNAALLQKSVCALE